MIQTKAELLELVKNGVVMNPHKAVAVDLVSIGLHLDPQLVSYIEHPPEPFVPPCELKTETINLTADGYVLKPNDAILGCSEEIIKMPRNLMGFIQTKGSLARGFLMAHACDGQIDPGYEGKVTFELINLSKFYFRLISGMPIAQLFLHGLASDAPSYEGRYKNSYAPTAMRPPPNR